MLSLALVFLFNFLYNGIGILRIKLIAEVDLWKSTWITIIQSVISATGYVLAVFEVAKGQLFWTGAVLAVSAILGHIVGTLVTRYFTKKWKLHSKKSS